MCMGRHGLWCTLSGDPTLLSAAIHPLEPSRDIPWHVLDSLPSPNDASRVGRARTLDRSHTHTHTHTAHNVRRWCCSLRTARLLIAHSGTPRWRLGHPPMWRRPGSGSGTTLHALDRSSTGQYASPSQQRGPSARSASTQDLAALQEQGDPDEVRHHPTSTATPQSCVRPIRALESSSR